MKVLAYNLAFLLFGIVLIELVFGSWIDDSRLNRLNVIRNYDRTYAVGGLYGPPGRTVHYRRDRYGLRGSYRDPATIDIPTVGGSTTDQRYISEGETWQDVTAALFLAEGRDIAVVNAGIDGHTTYGHIKSFELWFPRIAGLRARYVLVYAGVNDFSALGARFHDDLERNPPLEFFKANSALYHLFHSVAGTFFAYHRHRIGHHAVDFSRVARTPTPLRSDHAALMAPVLDAYTARLRRLDRRIAEFGARAIYVTQPRHDAVVIGGRVLGGAERTLFLDQAINGLDSHYMMRLLNRRTMDTCRELRALCLDLAAEVAFEDADFYDSAHNTPAGAAKIGRYLHHRLRQHL